jgi:hypothetical protein
MRFLQPLPLAHCRVVVTNALPLHLRPDTRVCAEGVGRLVFARLEKKVGEGEHEGSDAVDTGAMRLNELFSTTLLVILFVLS